ncbi:hypothetical protein BLNAU_23090 [Blattamonas nauphoetae]|uniref:SPRY domain-containing protein n=1 Tax=Blattamonas nauphoetae TaxID=2049346 RepID=A0ABQ9WR75_9EUKA|nr:hypothetical protein BLNAU_23090 [Blattamonas nauphoetae]
MAKLKDSFFVDLLMPSLYPVPSFPVWIKTLSLLATGIISITSLARYVPTLHETKFYTRFVVLLLLSLSTTIQFFLNIIPFRWNPRTALLFSNRIPHLLLDFAVFLNQINPALVRRRHDLMKKRLKVIFVFFSLALLATFVVSLIVIFQDDELVLPYSPSKGTSINTMLSLITFPQKFVLLIAVCGSLRIITMNNLKDDTRYIRHFCLIGLCILEQYIRLFSDDKYRLGPRFVSLLWHEYQRGSAISASWMNLADFVIFHVTPLPILPPFLFTDPLDFIVTNTTITRSYNGMTFRGVADYSTCLLEEIITHGIVSVTFTMECCRGEASFGLLDSSAPIPRAVELLGYQVENSVSLGRFGSLSLNLPSTGHGHRNMACHPLVEEGDCVRMEVDMDSDPRTVQFFVNGHQGQCFVSGLPSSVRIGITVLHQGTSFRIDRITQQNHPTPISPRMKEIHWDCD